MPALNLDIGEHYGKRDIERIGIFAEMQYLHGKGYSPPIRFINVRDMKNSQMYPGYPKWKTGLQDCYFDTQFKRVFAKEGWNTEFSRRLKEEMEMKKKYPLARSFMPPSYPKRHGCPGDYFGTLGGRVSAFSPLMKDIFIKKKGKKGEAQVVLGMKTSPGKKGGPGHVDICINRYPPYKSDPYDPVKGAAKKKEPGNVFVSGFHPNYFDKNPYLTTRVTGPLYRVEPVKKDFRGEFYPSPIGKKLGGCKAGCFSKFPQYKSDALGKVATAPKTGKKEAQQLPFMPQPHNKTMYTKSVMANKVNICVNAKNWRTFQPITYTQEFLSPQKNCNTLQPQASV